MQSRGLLRKPPITAGPVYSSSMALPAPAAARACIRRKDVL